MDVITMYTAVLQVTAAGLTPEEPDAWPIGQGPGWAPGEPGTLTPQLIRLQRGPAWMKRKRWVLELE